MWLDRLETQHDNLRGALEWSKTEPGGREAELRLAGALWRFWFVRGHWSEGRGWLERTLARSGDVQTPALLNVLRGAAWLAWHQRDFARAAALGERGLAFSRVLGNKEGIAWSLHILGLMAEQESDYERATALFEDSLALGRELGEKGWVSNELIQLGNVAREQGDHGRAAALYTEALTLARAVGEKRLIAYPLHNLGALTLDQGDYGRAEQFFNASLALVREIGERGFVALGCLEGRCSPVTGDISSGQRRCSGPWRHHGKSSNVLVFQAKPNMSSAWLPHVPGWRRQCSQRHGPRAGR